MSHFTIILWFAAKVTNSIHSSIAIVGTLQIPLLYFYVNDSSIIRDVRSIVVDSVVDLKR